MKIPIGFKDKNNKELCLGDHCITFDSVGRLWRGEIVLVNPEKLILKKKKYAFKSNYETWINNQKYASTLEVVHAPNR